MPIRATTPHRIFSIDTIRVLAAFAVVCIHTNPFGGKEYQALPFKLINKFIQVSCEFAIPFFFLVSGYFFARNIFKNNSISVTFVKYANRLGIIFFSWSIIYAVIPLDWPYVSDNGYWRALYWQNLAHLKQPVELLLRGTAIPLWFLVSLFLGLAFVSISYPRLKSNIFFITIPLYLYDCWTKAHHIYLSGEPMPFTAITGPYISFFFISIGFWFGSTQYKPTKSFSFSILAVGLVSGYISGALAILTKEYLVLFLVLDAVSKIFLSLSVALIALKLPHLGKNTFLPSLGKLTLGIYVCHPLIISMLIPIFGINGPFREISFPIAVFGIASGITYILSRKSLTKPLVI